MKAECLIIAEITGSITTHEQEELQELRRTSPRVKELSDRMHNVLDPQLDEILQIRTTSADKIIALGNDSHNEC